MYGVIAADAGLLDEDLEEASVAVELRVTGLLLGDDRSGEGADCLCLPCGLKGGI